MLKFLANLLFALGSNIALPITIGGWMCRFWPNHPPNYAPDWLWLATICSLLSLLCLLDIVKDGWGYRFFCKIWLDDGSHK